MKKKYFGVVFKVFKLKCDFKCVLIDIFKVLTAIIIIVFKSWSTNSKSTFLRSKIVSAPLPHNFLTDRTTKILIQ